MSEQVHAQITKIAATGSRLEKEVLLKALAADPLGCRVLQYTYDPFKTYGIKPKRIAGNPSISEELVNWQVIFQFLDDLAARKITGNQAKADLEQMMAQIAPASAELVFLILSKDLKCGIAETTINLAVPGLVPAFAVMRAEAYKEGHIKEWPWVIEPKLDGQRNTLLIKDGAGAFFTRSGKVVPALQFLVEPVLEVARYAVSVDPVLCEVMTGMRSFTGGGTQFRDISFMLDGEAMMGLFKDTGALRRKGVDATGAELHLYDILPYDDFNNPGANGLALVDRRGWLNRFVSVAHEMLGEDGPIQKVPQYFVNSHEEVERFFAQMLEKPLATYLARGDAAREREMLAHLIDEATGEPKTLEGAMVKNPAALYQKRKCREWLKLKAELSEDLIVIGAFPGEPHTKYENSLGGLIVRRGDVEVRVGGGFTDAQRDEIWKNFQKDVFHYRHLTEDRGGTKGIVFKAFPSDMTAVVERMAEIKFHEVTPDGSLRHPRFIRWRDDKQGELE